MTIPRPTRKPDRAARMGALFGLALALTTCGQEDPSPPLADVPVSVQLILSNYAYRDLRYDGRAIQLPTSSGGLRGIIVYRQDASTYRAYERLCPYLPQQNCATVNIDPSLLFMKDTCCGTQYDFQGNASGGPGARPLKQYNVSLVSGTLYITN